ncbi:MAG: site-2 protease family protein [Rhodothermales bacterium]|nr:site-2 protease family protein [Rhodothermales bacterium]
MKGVFRISKVSGIPVSAHWTMAVFFAWIFGMVLWRGGSIETALGGMVIVGSVFACVALHELGHALMARRFGIRTRDITLYPFGGIARLQGGEMKPPEELWVALAGPAVNVALAVMLYFVSSFTGQSVATAGILQPGGYLSTMMWLNISLAAFNMIPAFPMDGGRVLRAGLASSMRFEAATQIAVLVGTVIAAGFFLWGVVTLNPVLAFIGVFVFFGALQEAQVSRGN